MLCCAPHNNDEQAKTNKKISKEIRVEHRDKAKQKPIKLLLLGM